MTELRIAANLVIYPSYAGFNWGHFQLVYVNSSGNQLENEVQISEYYQFGDWTFPIIRDHTEITSNTTNYNIAGEYLYGTLLEGEAADAAWAILTQVHAQFLSAQNSGMTFP